MANGQAEVRAGCRKPWLSTLAVSSKLHNCNYLLKKPIMESTFNLHSSIRMQGI
jgi:hypothetical protein